jgi:hypothetical protein
MNTQEEPRPGARAGGASLWRRLLNQLCDGSYAMNAHAYPYHYYYRSARSLQLPDRQAERDRR